MKKRRKNFLLILFLACLLPLLRGTEDSTVPADAHLELDCPLVALTFDDGPRRATTEILLDGLAERGVQATFFLVGEMIPGQEDLVARMEQEGHQIGTHSYDHVYLTDLSSADFASQVTRTESLLTAITGRTSFPLRPPYGKVDGGVETNAHSPLILWSVDPEDWKDKNADRIVEHVVTQTKDGDVILLHDIYPTSVEAALRIVDALHQKGFLFVTVDELSRQRHIELLPGNVYRKFSS